VKAQSVSLTLIFPPACSFPSLVTTTMQPLWNPAQPQSDQRQLMLLVPRAMAELSQEFTFAGGCGTRAGRLEQLELWNAWNLPLA
jgi:hypothetical protein